MNLRHGCVVIALGMLLGSCSILPRSEAPNVYLLPATPVETTTHQAVRYESLRIVTPDAARTLDSTRIAVVPEGNIITSYQGARWSDSAPRLLRDRLLDAFRTDARFAALSSDDAQLQADLELTGDLRAFQSEYVHGVPVVVIRYDAQLVQGRSQKIMATHRFDIRQPVNGKEVPQVVTAFGLATDRLAAQVLGWVIANKTATVHD
ncbi:MAG: ABC-type transport auxiliary lipoprotein family protein [Rhodanobacter sp.]